MGQAFKSYVHGSARQRLFAGNNPLRQVRYQPHSNLPTIARLTRYCWIDVVTCNSDVKAMY